MAFKLVQVIVSLDSVNASINKKAGLAFAFTIYEYISSLIVVRKILRSSSINI